ncbi:hypothetical protein BH09BAC3_BH09BAC3_17740 [soil metagenome]
MLQLKNNKLLRPEAIQGFGTSKASYVSKIVTVDKSPIRGMVTDTAFLEVIVSGKMNLLYYRSEVPKTHFIIEKEDGSLEELGLKFLDQGDHKQFTKLTTYKDALKNIFPECTTLFPTIDKTPYDRNSIQKIYIKLYQCKYGENYEGATIRKVPYIELGVTAGYVSNSFAFKNDAWSYLPLMSFSNSSSVAGGVFLNIVIPRAWSLTVRNELLYSTYSSSAPETIIDAVPYNEIRASAVLKNSYLRYNLLVRKDISKNVNFTPFVNVGGSVSLLTSFNSTLAEKRSNNGTIYYEGENKLTNKHSDLEFGLIAGLGVKVKRLAVEARYEISNGIRPVDYVLAGLIKSTPDSPVSSFYFLLSYQFSK